MPKSAKTVTRRGQSKPPKDLARFIELSNAELNLPPEAFFDSAVRNPWTTLSPQVSVHWAKRCEEVASALPPEARTFLGPTANVKAFAREYATLWQAREALRAIAARSLPEASNYEEWESIWRAQRGLSIGVPCSVDLTVDEHGRLGTSPNPVLGALVGVRADRIRSCAICHNVFWAARVNSPCCSQRCRKIYNQRNSRKNRRAKRRMQRLRRTKRR